MEKTDGPAFDSVERALVFAFNASDVFHVASPLMNTAMAEVKVVVKAKRGKKPPEPAPDEELQRKSPSTPGQPGERLRGLNKAMQAGFILQVAGRLDGCQVSVLEARYTKPSQPCQCQSQCCRGFRPTGRWVRAIKALNEYLKEQADVLKVPGKRGLSTEPLLRKLLIERYFIGGSSAAAIAKVAKLSHITVAKHAAWIEGYLSEQETEAKLQIALLFDQEGITGLIE